MLFLLTARAQVGRYVVFQAVSTAAYALLLVLLLPRLGLLAAPWAQAADYGLLLLWSLWYFRREVLS